LHNTAFGQEQRRNRGSIAPRCWALVHLEYGYLGSKLGFMR
jgi:hypothetical protein